MRALEQQMVRALKDGVSKQCGSNTAVIRQGEFIIVELHGNQIAEIDIARKRVALSNAGWPTPTTKSRLNAIMAGLNLKRTISSHEQVAARVYQEKGVWLLGPNTEWYNNIEFQWLT